MSEMKPCPFCGGEAHIAHQSPLTMGVIVCDKCKAMVCFPWHKAEAGFELKKAWDKRSDTRSEGHFITEEEAIDMNDYSKAYTCSVCGECNFDCTEGKDFNFCPECGAKWRKPDEKKL